VLAQCQKQEAPPPRAIATPPVVDAAAVAATPARAPEAMPPDAVDAGDPPAPKGTWLDGNIYRFRFEDVVSCPPPGIGATARIGAVVRVTSKLNELLVASRDFKLEAGGVILDSAILTKAPAGCAPLLTPKSVGAGKTAAGVVVFDVPAEFNPEQRPVKISYQPTRWGGARKVEALLPPGSIPR
jgi:hypothetical protein